MPNIELTEKNLVFSFPDEAKAIKYDETIFYTQHYQSASGGVKAVDFAVIVGDVLWLIEVKDYRIGSGIGALAAISEVSKKIHDSLAGLNRARFGSFNEKDRRKVIPANEKDFIDDMMSCSVLRVAFHSEDLVERGGIPIHGRLGPNISFQMNVKTKLRSQCGFADLEAQFTSINILENSTEISNSVPYSVREIS